MGAVIAVHVGQAPPAARARATRPMPRRASPGRLTIASQPVPIHSRLVWVRRYPSRTRLRATDTTKRRWLVVAMQNVTDKDAFLVQTADTASPRTHGQRHSLAATVAQGREAAPDVRGVKSPTGLVQAGGARSGVPSEIRLRLWWRDLCYSSAVVGSVPYQRAVAASAAFSYWNRGSGDMRPRSR